MTSRSFRKKIRSFSILKTVRGRGGGTWGHWQIALAYAKYLDHNLHIQVNEWARRYVEEEIEPEKGVDRAIKNWKRQGKSDKWIQTRLENKQVRHQLTSTLQKHGVSQPFQYANCTNAINKQVLGGTAQQLKEKKGLAKRASLRDNLSRVEVAALGLAEALADVKGCCKIFFSQSLSKLLYLLAIPDPPVITKSLSRGYIYLFLTKRRNFKFKIKSKCPSLLRGSVITVEKLDKTLLILMKASSATSWQN